MKLMQRNEQLHRPRQPKHHRPVRATPTKAITITQVKVVNQSRDKLLGHLLHSKNLLHSRDLLHLKSDFEIRTFTTTISAYKLTTFTINMVNFL